MVTGQTFAQVAKRVADILQDRPTLPPKNVKQDEENRHAIKRIWEASGRPSNGGPVCKYLKRRLGLVWSSKSFREFIGQNHCLMVSQIVGPDNKAHNVHLTYLDHNGYRAKINTPKRIMSGKVPAGSAIRLAPADEVMGIAEGIETAIAASVMHGIPVWSAINAHNLAKWEPPPVTRSVIVFGDNDESFTGHAASYSLARRLKLQRKLDVTVMIPETVGQDWADVLAQVSKGQDR
jgi:putative DNA primase/helicase